MGAAYTPGLTVSAHATIRKTRRLPLKGAVLVQPGDAVLPDTVVARAELPGLMLTHRIAASLGIDAAEVPAALSVQVGDVVTRHQVLAQTRGLWGLFRSEARALAGGTVELVSSITGNVGVREPATPVEVTAYIPGEIAQVLPDEGVIVEAHGALVQGIFGVGGERRAPLRRVVSSPDSPLTADDITPDMAGQILVGGSQVTGDGLRRAAEIGAAGVVTGGIVDTDLVEFLGHDIGVAITGHEAIPLTLILTEGFGRIAMAQRTFDLLGSVDGQEASISGATQIRAGVIRPEIIVAGSRTASAGNTPPVDEEANTLSPGTPIRVIREPYFGRLAVVTALPPQLVRVASGAEVRVLTARLSDTGEEVTVPRANVEILL